MTKDDDQKNYGILMVIMIIVIIMEIMSRKETLILGPFEYYGGTIVVIIIN